MKFKKTKCKVKILDRMDNKLHFNKYNYNYVT